MGLLLNELNDAGMRVCEPMLSWPEAVPSWVPFRFYRVIILETPTRLIERTS